MPVAPVAIEIRIASKIAAPPHPIFRVAPILAFHESLGVDPAFLRAFPYDPDACWIWIGAYSRKKGPRYDKGADRPVIQYGRRGTPVVPVFRVMLSLKDGVPLWRRAGLHACHAEACSDPKCINPYHGYWGSPGRNHQDRERYAPETFKRKTVR